MQMKELDTGVSLPNQRRKFFRFNIAYPVRMTFEVSGSAVNLEMISKNVSIDGLLVRSASAIPLHTPVSFVISVHGEQAVRPVHLVGEGKIVRVECNQADATFSLAVQCVSPLTQLDEQSRLLAEKVK